MAIGSKTHRLEIDGLRAIAVLAVVLFHYSIPGFGGGFVGVDIFFVISGFLIGDILWREYSETGKISLIKFYERRIKRLAPAFVVMAIVTTAAAYFILLPFEFREYGKTLIVSTVYLSNVYFFRQTGYFDTASDEKALLHTWSLSVEEQFYIFLPLFILLFARSKNWLIRLLIGVFVISLIGNLVVTPRSSAATFFLFPFRAWELLAGVLLAIYGYQAKESWSHSAWISWLGLALLCASIVLVQPGASFPGWQAIFPVAGSVLILFNGRSDNIVNHLLSSSVMVFVGLISYSLYLWHWPVLTLALYFCEGDLSSAQIAGLMVLSFVLAFLSWKYVEQPIRFQWRVSALPLFGGAFAASVALLAIGSVLYLRDGVPERFSPVVQAHIEASGDFLQDWSRCSVSASGPFEGVEVCKVGPEGPAEFIVWGDSHVRALMEGFAVLAREHKQPGLLIWRAGCPPLFDVEKAETAATPQQNADCAIANNKIREAFPTLTQIDRILLVGRWSYYAQGGGVGIDAENKVLLRSSLVSKDEQGDNAAIFQKAVHSTVAELSKSFRSVIVLQQFPEIQKYDTRVVARRLAHGRMTLEQAKSKMFYTPKNQVMSRVRSSEQPFLELAAAGKITWLKSWDRFCSNDRCSAVHEGRSLYFDNNHVVNRTAIRFRDMFLPLVTKSERAHVGSVGSL